MTGNSWGRLPLLVLVLTALGLVYGVAELFRLRFARGDVYPPYSSLRADPLGTRVLAEGLGSAGVELARHLGRLDRGTLSSGTWYLAGMDWDEFSSTTDDKWQALLDMVNDGGRLVIAFNGGGATGLAAVLKESRHPREEKREPDDGHPGNQPPDDGDKDMPEPEPDAASAPQPAPHPFLPVRLGVKRATIMVRSQQGVTAERDTKARQTVPAEITWHSPIAFTPDGPAWQVVYTVGDKPVVLARSWGRGSIVLAGDTFPLSNEAILRARVTPWLVWLQGPNPRAVFDESHLGVAEAQGVVTLARRYGLAHTAFVLAAIGLLFVWKNNASLIPAAGDASDAGAEASGRESATGFVNLLQRTLPSRGLFAASLAEFRHSAAWRRLTPDLRRSLDDLAATESASPDPLRTTRAAHALLARKP